MNDPGVLPSIEQRIAELERGYRRTRFAAVVFGAIAAVTILTAQTSPAPSVFGDPQGAHTTIGSSGVRVFDAQGKLRLDMTLDSSGTPGFDVLTNGKAVASMIGGAAGGWVKFAANGGNQAAFAGVYTDGTSGMDIFDTQGNRRMNMSMDKNGTVGYDIRNADGKVIVSLNADADNGFLRIRDKNLVQRAYVGLYSDGSSALTSYTSSGTAAWSTGPAR